MGVTGVETQRPSLGMLGMPPIARTPPARGEVVVGRLRARLKTGGIEAFWNLFHLVSFHISSGNVGRKELV